MKTITIRNVTIGDGSPKIIIPIMGETKEQLLQEIKEVKALSPDMIEWRADVFDQVENPEAVREMIFDLRELAEDTPLLFTFRSHKEGGNKEVSSRYYVKLLQAAIRTKKMDLVDIELLKGDKTVKKLAALAEANGVYVIISNHDFKKTPSKKEIINRLRKMQVLGADIPKIAVMPNSVQDVITLLDATNTMKIKYADRPIITMSMAETGLISRLSGEIFGSACTFGAGKQASAPGQIPAPELRTVLEILHKNM